MAANLYEMIATRNSVLAKFYDENPRAALMAKKVISMITNISDELRWPAEKLDYEVFSPRGSDCIVIKIRKV